MTEVWKEIKGFNGFYEVSNLGRVRSYRGRNTRLREPHILVGGYYRRSSNNFLPYRYALLYKNGQNINKKISALVLEAFIGKRPKNYESSHLNGDCCDDRLTNLAWETRQQNISRKNGSYIIGGRYNKNMIKQWVRTRRLKVQTLLIQGII